MTVNWSESPVVAQPQSGEDYKAIPLGPPYVSEQFGIPIFFAAEGQDEEKIITPGNKHLEIGISLQRLRAYYDESGRLALEALVSTGKAEVDAKGRQRSETRPGIFRVPEVKPFKRWCKNPRIKM